MAWPTTNVSLVCQIVLVFLVGVSPTCCIWARRSDIDSPPIEPAESHAYQTRAKRATAAHQDPEISSRVAAGYLMADSTDQRLLNLSDPLDLNLSMILDRIGPDMRASRDYHDFKDISLDISKRAWRLMREHAKVAVGDRITIAGPTIRELLREAGAADKCVAAIESTFDGAKRLESWAIKLLNSWGSFPTSGLFEGTYGDVGAFHTCVNIDKNKYIDHAHYCSVTFRPVMRSSQDYELIVRKEPLELRRYFEERKQATSGEGRAGSQTSGLSSNRAVGRQADDKGEPSWERDAMTDLLEQAQYHHFVYYKWGTCWPIACTPFDVRRIARLVGRKNIFMSGPVKCYSRAWDDYEQEFEEPDDLAPGERGPASAVGSKNASAPLKRKRRLVISVWDKNGGIFIWKPHFNRAQKIAASILVSLTGFILTMTLIDLCYNELPVLFRKLVLSMRGLPLASAEPGGSTPAQGLHLATPAPTSPIKQFALSPGPPCPATPAPVRKHSSRPGFQMVPSAASACLDNNNTFDDDDHDDNGTPPARPSAGKLRARPPGLYMSMVNYCSILNNCRQFFRVTEGQLKNDILCLHGIRCITMIWIILNHTMAYNDWSAFARTREIEVALNSLIIQPLFNGSYLVDTFFLMSGLLSALTAFRHCQGLAAKFNSFAYIFGRWLRLTPQVLFASLIYIVLPASSYGPHWFPMVGEYSENCVKNWWINVLHLQAFYKTEEMCNFVTWWISIDFFYHFLALAAIWIILRAGHKWGFWSLAILVLSQIVWQSKRHYELALPPNVLSTIPQTGAMWTTMTLQFYWTPYAHAVPFFFGFYIGYLMALKTKVIRRQLNTRRALIGWLLAISLLLGQQYSTYWWVVGKASYSRPVSTLFFGLCSLAWNGSICWIIIACQHGYGGFINRLLSSKVFIVLGKASYLIYLTHFQVLFMFFGNQTLLIEPTTISMAYIIVGNIFLATVYGTLLCCVYEMPWLKAHRQLMKYF